LVLKEEVLTTKGRPDIPDVPDFPIEAVKQISTILFKQ